jgi:hypothetical protein
MNKIYLQLDISAIFYVDEEDKDNKIKSLNKILSKLSSDNELDRIEIKISSSDEADIFDQFLTVGEA